ncbi:sporulation associated protein [Colletotrichum kahawae]|uniref:Sporulation associated protein n=1 Tax=Colletotrichum kahawae TaxID=34407 RepID=A0AAD9Y216_COLKA|nr:sporulation associated protein [Colletotrichum kahawae]
MPPIYPLSSNTEESEGKQSKEQKPEREPRNLVLFFDGTGNEFTGSDKDTNVVKLLNMMDRNACNQYHYYQSAFITSKSQLLTYTFSAGIGTYDVKEKTVHKSSFGEMKSSFWKMVDQGIGTTFDAHVIAGYRFLMQYYAPGDRIYVFGFSRGAYTARFLSRMVFTVGLLCKGNEEMIPFAYRLYQRHLNGEFKASKKGDHHISHRNDYNAKQSTQECTAATCELVAFSDTFCWRAARAETNVKVFFLGLWDCVNSVSVLEKKTTVNVKVKGTADIIRHAVAVDERRVKFKPALFDQDTASQGIRREHIKEVWFPGNHGDVGGGWHPDGDFLWTDDKKASVWLRLESWKKLRGLRENLKLKEKRRNDWGQCERHHKTLEELEDCETEYSKSYCPDNQCGRCPPEEGKKEYCFHDYRMRPCQLSDAPLYWMIQEIEQADNRECGDEDFWPKGHGIKWHQQKLDDFKVRYLRHKDDAVLASLHDPLKFGFGDTIEFYPLAKRWELKRETVRADKQNAAESYRTHWHWQMFPLNMGETRDIPCDAVLHSSLVDRIKRRPTYRPVNNSGEIDGKETPYCLISHDKQEISHKIVERPLAESEKLRRGYYTFEKETT